MKLYGTPPTRVIKAQWLLNELELSYQLIPVDLMNGEHLQPDFLALNPAAKVPVLVDGELVLPESNAIALYLAEKHPEAELIPNDLAERAQMHRWLSYLVTEVEQPLWRIAKHTFIYPEESRLPGEVALAEQDGRRALSVLEEHLKDRDWVVGQRVCVADFVAAYTQDWAAEAGLLDSFPALSDYLEKMYARPRAPQRIGSLLNVD